MYGEVTPSIPFESSTRFSTFEHISSRIRIWYTAMVRNSILIELELPIVDIKLNWSPWKTLGGSKEME